MTLQSILSYFIRKNKPVFILIGIAIYTITRQNILNEYTINNDASQHLIWLNDWSNYNPDDETIEFSKLIQPIGFSLIISTLSKFLPIKCIVILLDFVKCLILLFISLSLSNRSYNNNALKYLFFGALYIISINLGDIGISRSFASLFILLAVYFETSASKSHLLLKICNFLISAIVYPPAFLIICIYYIIYNLKVPFIKSALYIIKKNWILNIVILIGFAFNFISSHEISNNKFTGKTIDREFILNDPHAGNNGRINLIKYWKKPIRSLLSSTSRIFIPKQVYSIQYSKYVVPLLIFIFILFVLRRQRNSKSIALILTGIILYTAAIVFPFKLYIPERYIHYTFSIGILVFIGNSFLQIKNYNKLYNTISVIFFLFSVINNINYRENNYSCFKDLYSKCENIIPPKSMIVTNDISLANMIPYFSNRSVYVSYENLHAIYYKNYRERQDHKMSVWNEIFSTKSSKRLEYLLHQNKIDCLVAKAPYYKILTHNIDEPYKIHSVSGSNALEVYLKTKNSSEFQIGKETFRIYSLR